VDLIQSGSAFDQPPSGSSFSSLYVDVSAECADRPIHTPSHHLYPCRLVLANLCAAVIPRRRLRYQPAPTGGESSE
jgi:hypothetical protein